MSDKQHGHEPDLAHPIVVQNLTKRFGEFVAVDDVSFSVNEGEVFGWLGPNGAGKTTTIRMLLGLLHPTSGSTYVLGYNSATQTKEMHGVVGYMSQQFCLYPDLSLAENLDFFALVRGVPRAARRERAASLTEAMGLAEFTRRQAGRLSGGMKQKLMLASVLMHQPRILLLDEPTTGVDPVSRREFWRILGDLNAAGTTVLVATPYMDEAERCTDIAFMDAGRIGTRGTPASVKALLPGTLLEIESGRPRDALAAVAGRPEVASAHLLGQAVRVLWTGPDAAASVSSLVAPAVPDAVVHGVVPDMEAVFAYLADPDRDAA